MSSRELANAGFEFQEGFEGAIPMTARSVKPAKCANCGASPLANAMVNFGKVAICDECLNQVLKQWEPRWTSTEGVEVHPVPLESGNPKTLPWRTRALLAEDEEERLRAIVEEVAPERVGLPPK